MSQAVRVMHTATLGDREGGWQGGRETQGARQMASAPASILTRRDLAASASVRTRRCSICQLCGGSSWHKSKRRWEAAAASGEAGVCHGGWLAERVEARCSDADAACRLSLRCEGMRGSAKSRRNRFRRAARSSGSLPAVCGQQARTTNTHKQAEQAGRQRVWRIVHGLAAWRISPPPAASSRHMPAASRQQAGAIALSLSR